MVYEWKGMWPEYFEAFTWVYICFTFEGFLCRYMDE